MTLESMANYTVKVHRPDSLFGYVALAILLVFLLCLSVYSHQSLNFELTEINAQVWLQPDISADQDNVEQVLISSKRWQFDFSLVEEKFLLIKIDQHGDLKVDEQLADILDLVCTLLPKTLDSENVQRVAILLEKMYPGGAGQQLAQVFYNFYHYRQALSETNVELLYFDDPSEAIFRREQQLQNQFLGEGLAKKLFAKKGRIKNYLLQRKLINQNDSLTLSEKQQQLSDLKNEFQGSRP